ncbi:AAA family ATPase [Pseudonocardia sp. TRM90224]|uniref:AAA family ATPase n=1 Tax=Pseudonocardia sp. TRM90224 TaxID=2812678 RepID=UPI001E564EF1|nr:AAA family ATPase [Pseudonocardia sp. TRM90224]
MAIWFYRIDINATSAVASWLFYQGDDGPDGILSLPSRNVDMSIGDAVVLSISDALGAGDLPLGVVAFGVVRASPAGSVRSRMVVIELMVKIVHRPISDFELVRDEVLRRALITHLSGPSSISDHWVVSLGVKEWEAILDHCPLDVLVEIDRLLVPGALSAAGHSSRRYHQLGAREYQFARGDGFGRLEDAQSETRFKHLSVRGWRQFAEIDIDLSSRLTVITGENGAGKTSLLHLLSPHFNWNNPIISTPRRSIGHGVAYETGIEGGEARPASQIAHLVYSNEAEASIQLARDAGVNFQVAWSGQNQVNGLYIPSHRAVAGYSPVATIPTAFSTGSVLLEQFLGEVRSRYAGTFSGKSAGQWMKESLLAAAYHGAGSGSDDVEIEKNAEAYEVWQGFQVVLRRLLPPSLGFRSLVVRTPEIVIVTERGEFSIDAASGGISALVELGWQIFLRSREVRAFTVVFDEPENHLHPELQRSILPRLLEAFPNVSFVAATHSPFVVTSVAGAHVYALEYTESGVVSYRVDPRRGVKSAEEVLRRVLGVGSTLPMWADAALDEIVSDYRDRQMTPELFRQLRLRLDEVGLLDEFPATAAALAERQIDA